MMDFQKIKKYGFILSFYRALHRIVSKFYLHPDYFYRKYFFGYAVKKINGVKMYLDLKNDEGISSFLMKYGKREPLTVDYFMESGILRQGDIALDVGANIGYYALLESRMVGNSGIVYAVEPIKNNLNTFKKSIHINKISNIKTYNLAMGDANREEVDIYMRSKGNLSSLTVLSQSYGKVVSVEKVPMMTVDSFVKKEMSTPPKFIRMDVEGYESHILEGMAQTLYHKPHLQIEFHPLILTKDQKDRICELLRDKRYSKVTITINPKPRLNILIRWLNNKIGESYNESGNVYETDIEHLHNLLFSSSRIFNAFIS